MTPSHFRPKPAARYVSSEDVSHGINIGDRVAIFGNQMATVKMIGSRTYVRFDGGGLIPVHFALDEPYIHTDPLYHGQMSIMAQVSLTHLDTSRFFPRDGSPKQDMLFERWKSRRSKAPRTGSQLQMWSEWINRPRRSVDK